MTPLPPWALAAGLAVPLLATGAGLVVMVRSPGSDGKRLARRLAALTAPAASSTPAARMSLSTAAPPVGLAARWRARLMRAVGYDTNVPAQPLPAWAVCALALVAARAVTWLAQSIVGPPAWLGLPPVAFLVVRMFYRWSARRWQDALFNQFPDALATIVRAVRVGVALPEGIRRVAQEAPEPTAAIFARIAGEMAIGTPLHDAMAASTLSTGLPEYRFFATALVLQSRAGGGLAATLDGLAEVIRKRVSVRARGKALASEARASAAILAVLPVFTLVALLLINPGYAALLFTTATGHMVLAAACGIEGLGILVMRGLIRRALS